MALMQNAFKHQANTFKTWIQQGNMNIHAILSKFHIEHAQNGETVKHIHSKHNITTSCPKTATRHLASIKTVCYSISTWKQKAWALITGKSWQNMNTKLSLENTITCSKGHGKIANNNSFRLSRNNIRLQCLELSNNMLQELIMANKGMAWYY